jgi:hypothetical protein
MPHPPEAAAAAALAACLRDSARGRARTVAQLRVSGPGALEEALLLAATTAWVALGLLRLF